MFVYVLTQEPFHDNSTIHGVFRSLEAAEEFTLNGQKINWQRSGHHVSNQKSVVSQGLLPKHINDDDDFLIHEFELDI